MAETARWLCRLVTPDGQAEARRDGWQHVIAPRAPDADLRNRTGVGAEEITGENLRIGGFDIQSIGRGVGNLEPLVHGVGRGWGRNRWRRVGGGEDFKRQVEAGIRARSD